MVQEEDFTPSIEEFLPMIYEAKAKAIKQEDKREAKLEDDVLQHDEGKTFKELGVCDEICEAVKKMGYKHPSKI